MVQQITFEAKDDAEVFRIASERLGQDAVVLSTRPIKKGGILGFFQKTVLLVTAGILEDNRETQVQETRDRMLAFRRLLEIKEASAPEMSSVPKESVPGAPTSVGLAVAEKIEDRMEISAEGWKHSPKSKDAGCIPKQSEQEDLRKEVKEIHRTLAGVLEHLRGEDKEPSVSSEDSGNGEADPEGGRKLDSLIQSGVESQRAALLLEKYNKSGLHVELKDWLKEELPPSFDNTWDAIGGRKVMFIGPTGVGKTTTIAKLAAINALWEGKKILLLTADTYRIAAVEQLKTYAKILGVPVEVVFDPSDLKPILNRYSNVDLILLDTAGRSQRDSKRIEELKELYESFEPDMVHLVIAANSKYRDMLDIVDRMGTIPISRFLFTKLDETLSYGPLIELLLDFNRSVSFFTVGQNVPNDIEVASSERLVDLVVGGENPISA